ncbi:MAG: hypothetical protein WA252_20300 [Candidatus Sulfotelmatobacter sp.]
MSNRLSRYPHLLLQIKLYAFETVSTIVVLVLLADFAIKELQPIVRSIMTLWQSP